MNRKGRRITLYKPDDCIYEEITINANIEGIIEFIHTFIDDTVLCAVSVGYNKTRTAVRHIAADLAADKAFREIFNSILSCYAYN